MTIAFKQNLIYILILMIAAVTSVIIYRATNQDWILFRDAEAQYEMKNFKEAIELYNKSLKEGFLRFHMSVNLANSYVAVGQFKEGIQEYREYLVYHPKNFNARLDLAKALSWTGNTKEAEEEYKIILEKKNEK